MPFDESGVPIDPIEESTHQGFITLLFPYLHYRQLSQLIGLAGYCFL